MNLVLSPRLKIIADSINDCDTVADIGSDHAYLPIYLVKAGKVKKAIAADVNKGPIEISRKKLKNHRADKLVSVRHGNGLEVIVPGEAEVIVIAGMGGLLIRDILDKGLTAALSAKTLILQPMKDSDAVRKWLFSHGFDIFDEELVKEQDRIYEVLWARPGGEPKAVDDVMLVGEWIIKKRHPLAAAFVMKKVKELDKIIGTLKEMDMASCRERTEECKRLLNYYLEVLKWVQ